ncbi:MAG TPA: glycosyltransferase family A protein [Polyangiaceae bacterium]|nr:glycosyltransferase family A protein [Polyangiaceae bacterium]
MNPPTPSEPLISVVITCFNYAQYVGEAIESALAQTYSNLEVVVVDDGSTDASRDVIARYATRVRGIEQPNQGVAAACARGAAASRGDIVIFLDADDRLEPEALARVAAAWSPTSAKVQYDLTIIDATGRELGRRFCHFTKAYDAAHVRAAFERTGTYRWPVTTGNAYSRALVDAVFPVPDDAFPDGVLNSVAPLYGDIVTIPEPLACYRLHGASAWSLDGSRAAGFARRIERRRREVAVLRLHASRRQRPLPAGDVLDHELSFVNYRLMALKLGLEYPGRPGDSTSRLLFLAWRALRGQRFPVRVSMTHLAWFVAFSLAPGALARGLVAWRYERAAPRRLAERALAGLARSLQRAREEAS